jgi:hypothetical protein
MTLGYKMYNSSRKRSSFVHSVVQLLVCSPVTGPFLSNAFNSKALYKSRCKGPIPSLVQMHGDDGGDNSVDPGMISAYSIYFDIEVANQPIGRLIFHVTNPSSLPKHAENIIQLAKGSRRGIDPKAHYVGCEFDFSPSTVEDGLGRYRWSHQLKGRGRNGIGRADELITDPESQAGCCHSTFGGQYYGDIYTKIENDPSVLLTVPVVGPGYGSSKFSIVRVEESPKEWRETLLMNSGVIGRLDISSLETLHAMARQRNGPPTIVSGGVLDDSDKFGSRYIFDNP